MDKDNLTFFTNILLPILSNDPTPYATGNEEDKFYVIELFAIVYSFLKNLTSDFGKPNDLYVDLFDFFL